MDLLITKLNISKLKRKMDISNLTIHINAVNGFSKGRFYILWKNGNYLVIQAEPWCRPGVVYDPDNLCCYIEEYKAHAHVQEIIQTMLDTIVIDGEHNWAYLVRLKDDSYRLVYKKRVLVNCSIWTKVVELDDIEITRLVSGLMWEGIYEGKEVDLYIGWEETWATFVTQESRGNKLLESLGLSKYFFIIEAHVSKNGVIVGLMKAAVRGRNVTPADRSAVFEAIGDILRHGINIYFQICDIFVTDGGIRFASASSAVYYRDRDELAEKAKRTWKVLTDMFDNMEDEYLRNFLKCHQSYDSFAFIIPRLPSPGRPITQTHEEAIIRWIWSAVVSEGIIRLYLGRFDERLVPWLSAKHSATRRNKRIKRDKRILLSPDNSPDDLQTPTARIESVDQPLVVHCDVIAPRRHHPYARPTSGRLLLAPESDL